jgi:hypothetical protein
MISSGVNKSQDHSSSVNTKVVEEFKKKRLPYWKIDRILFSIINKNKDHEIPNASPLEIIWGRSQTILTKFCPFLATYLPLVDI